MWYNEFQSAVRISVWLKTSSEQSRVQNCLVSIRRADLCLVEVLTARVVGQHVHLFQSAVRISVWLKATRLDAEAQELRRFNPPCGSLFG